MNKNITFTGKFISWKKAQKYSNRYDNFKIFEKVKDSTIRVKNGEASYERDSVTFNNPQYSSSTITILLLIAAKNNGILNILDFGGSLGSAYFQNKHLLDEIDVEWSIVEQEHFVKYGKKELSDDILKFYFDLDECLQEKLPNVLMASNTLQYLEDPYHWVGLFIKSQIEYIFLDTTTFSKNNDEYITIQHVPRHIYKTSYPLHVFNQENVIRIFSNSGYRLLHKVPIKNDAETKDFFFEGLLFNKI